MKTVLCYGDSNTYGYMPGTGNRYPKEQRWTGVLEKLLGSDYEIVEEGLNGRTMAFPRPGAPWKNGLDTIKPLIVSHKPVDILVIMLGTNDCGTDVEASLDDLKEAARSLVRAAKEVSLDYQGFIPKILLAAPAPISPEFRSSPFSDKLDEESVKKSCQIARLQQEVAEEEGLLFMDAGKFVKVAEPDSEHLTKEGHEILGKEIAKIIIQSELGTDAKTLIALGNRLYYDDPIDFEMAAFCYKLAADMHDPEGQCLYGYSLRKGIGTEKNPEKAFELFRSSADAGFAMAQYNVAYCLENGLGTDKDTAAAGEWYQKAKDNGYEEYLPV